MRHDDYPYASSFSDRHGKERWRFRKGKKTVSLPGLPGEPAFDAAYIAAVEGRPVEKASVTEIPTSSVPRSLKAAWRLVTTATHEWTEMEPETRRVQQKVAEAFLASPVVEGNTTTWGMIPVADLKRRHLKTILAERSDTPHAARHLVGLIRKMIGAALDEEWIETDPTYRLKFRPAYKGWRAWTAHERALFEARWPIGTTPRLAYALALWLGNRRGDVATLPVSAIQGDIIVMTQGKTGRALRLTITPMLREVLDATDMRGPTVLLTAYGQPFSAKSLTGRMADWTKAAKMPKGCTLHGLRKSLGKMLAESGATTRQIMDTLGHTDIKHAELYSKEAEQEVLARDGMNAVTIRFQAAKKSAG